MAEQIAPTRSNLLQRRDQLQLANRGADLLKRKRDALITEFFDLVQSSLDARRSLAGTSQEAYFSLFLANAWDGPEAVESLSLAAQSGLDVDIKMENLFGVKVPQVQPPSFNDDLPFSPINAGARTLDAAREFRKLTEALIKVAATETRLRRIGEEIKKTNRRVNALEQLVIPGINQQIKDIRSVLDQRALEEVTVLKRIKAKLEAREEEEKEAEQDARAESETSEPYPDNDTSMAETVEDIESVGVVSESAQGGSDEGGAEKSGSATVESTSAKTSAKAQSSGADSTAEAGVTSSPKASSAETSSPRPSKTDSQTKASASKTSDKTGDKVASAIPTQASTKSEADATSKAASSTAKPSEAKAFETSSTVAQGDATKESAIAKSSQPANASTSSKGAAAETASSGSDGLLLGADAEQYVANLQKYTSDVNGNVVRAILESFGEAVNDRDAMTVACSQPKELRYVKKHLLKGRLNLESPDEVLDNALQEVCEQMGRSNRNKSSVTFYYLVTEKFGKLPVWLA